MKSENELYETITNQWFETEKKIIQSYSRLAENNKKFYERPLDDLISFDDAQKTLWEKVNLLDQLSIESDREQAILVNSLRTLLAMWHEHQDQPAMKNASKRFLDHDVARIVKSMHTVELMTDTINALRHLVANSSSKKSH